MKRAIIPMVLGLVLSLGGGCSYYAVTDMRSGRMYYTRQVKRHKDSRETSFKDAETGLKVTVQDSVVARISPAEYNRGVDRKPQ